MSSSCPATTISLGGINIKSKNLKKKLATNHHQAKDKARVGGMRGGKHYSEIKDDHRQKV